MTRWPLAHDFLRLRRHGRPDHRDRADRRRNNDIRVDLAGRMTTLTDPDNNITTWTYTQANEVATEVNPSASPQPTRTTWSAM